MPRTQAAPSGVSSPSRAGDGSSAAEYARAGKDWEVELHQRAKERQLMKQLGLIEEPKPSQEIDTDVEQEQAT